MNEIGTSLIAVLNEQIRCAESMLETLGRENKALVDGNSDRLDAATADKARLVADLEVLETRRRILSETIGGSTQDNAQPRTPTQPEWQTLLELVAACKTQNQRNGALVKARSEQVHIALQALRGSDPGFYDPSGLTPSARSARPLGTA